MPDGEVAGSVSFLQDPALREETYGDVVVLAIMMPNHKQGLPVPPGMKGVPGRKVIAEQADAYLTRQMVSIQRLKQLVGFELVPELKLEALKNAVTSALWPRN